MIEVHLYRPFSKEYLVSQIPESVKNIAVLNMTKEMGSIGEPLYLDVVASLTGKPVNVVGGRYGLSSKNVTPSDIYSVYKMLEGELKNNFTIGIEDDVTNLNLEHYEIDLEDKILFIEEVNEAPYAVDRMLSSLLLSGKLNNVKGIICGYFTGCESESNQTVDELLVHYFKPLNVPFITNFQSGHSKPFVNIPVGLKVKLDTYQKHVTVLESLFED